MKLEQIKKQRINLMMSVVIGPQTGEKIGTATVKFEFRIEYLSRMPYLDNLNQAAACCIKRFKSQIQIHIFVIEVQFDEGNNCFVILVRTRVQKIVY